MLVAGVVAYVLEENGFPVAPAILGVVLGGMLEENFVTSMIKSDGNLLAFFDRPVAADAGRADAGGLVPAAADAPAAPARRRLTARGRRAPRVARAELLRRGTIRRLSRVAAPAV